MKEYALSSEVSSEDDWLWLCSIPGLNWKEECTLLHYFGSVRAVREARPEELRPWQNLDLKWIEGVIRRKKSSWSPEAEKEKLSRLGIRFLSREHPQFPSRLRQLPDCPYGIFVRGDLPPEGKLSVAVVGARRCSSYGYAAAREIAREVAAQSWLVISGMAAGIDGAAQIAALEGGGYSCAVLGCGADICYPREHFRLYMDLNRRGGIISEYPPGTRPEKGHFPMRNRLISGLSDIVVVIEAAAHSGSLITADLALEQGREVAALPGRCSDPLSEGCNRLISSGAGIILSTGDFIDFARETGERLFPGTAPQAAAGSVQGKTAGPEACKEIIAQKHKKPGSPKNSGPALIEGTTQELVFHALDFEPRDINWLCDRLGLPVQEISDAVTMLQISGLITEAARHKYVRATIRSM